MAGFDCNRFILEQAMKLGITVWEEKVSPLLDTASRILICQLEDQEEIRRFETFLEERELSRRCSRIHGLGIDTLICGAISRPCLSMLTGLGVKVVPWISGYSEDVLQAYRDGTLFHAKYLMPGRTRHGSEQKEASGEQREQT
jgi:predicted Fe-Mo cluster-binding NifX family protein